LKNNIEKLKNCVEKMKKMWYNHYVIGARLHLPDAPQAQCIWLRMAARTEGKTQNKEETP
jgi:hypothetical protein